MSELPELWLHQKECIEKARSVNDLAIFHEMGVGKTRSTIEILREKFTAHGKVLRTLIICPLATCLNWKNEIAKYSKINPKSVRILSGNLADRASEWLNNDGIFITNFEALSFPKFSGAIVESPPTILIIDESHKLKEPSAKRTKALIKLSHVMEKLPLKHRYILTGSPVLNSEMDIFSQYLILNAGATFGTNFFSFRGTYFRDCNEWMPRQKHFPNFVARPGATEAIKKLMEPISVHAKKSECLDLPDLVKMEVEVPLSPDQKKAYEEMKKDFISFVDSGVAVANLAITKALRMQQIISGFLKLEGGEIHRFKSNPRADALHELLEDITPHSKVIVWCIFHADYDTVRGILNNLNIEFAEVTGLTKDKQAELSKFDNDPKCRVMLASQSAGGVGVNMIEASYMIYYSRSYSLGDDMQSESRNYRGGSEKHEKITRIDLVAKGTVDDIVLTALRSKKDLASSILELRKLL